MKKIAPHISCKRGSMLMLTLIVFMVILILGMTMITSMLYSQGENTMQINEQKAYYAALSAVEAVKAYFLNPKLDLSITSPRELIGGGYTYNLNKDQEINEDTTVKLSIERDKEDAQYILIKATGICQGEESTVIAKMLEEVKEGVSEGIYDSEVVFGSKGLMITKETLVKGNIYLDTQDLNYYNTINYLNMIKTEKCNSNLYIKNFGSDTIRLTDSNLTDVYVETQHNMQIGNGQSQSIDNIYLRSIKDSVEIAFSGNKVTGEAQLYLRKIPSNMYNNIINKRLVLGVKEGILESSFLTQIKAKQFYIKGVEKLVKNWGSSWDIEEIYIDSNIEVDENFVFTYNMLDLTNFVASEEQRISNVISRLAKIGAILETKPSWNKDIIKNNYDEMVQKGNGVLSKDPLNHEFEEYYDTTTSTRWVFTNDNHGVGQGYTIMNRKDYAGNGNSRTYYISNNPVHKNDTIFFINHNENNVLIQPSSNTRLENFYVYTPRSECSFQSSFEYFGGGIIAKAIKIAGNGPKEVEYKAASERIRVTGAPSVDEDFNNSGSSSETTYSYTFESYVDKKVS